MLKDILGVHLYCMPFFCKLMRLKGIFYFLGNYKCHVMSKTSSSKSHLPLNMPEDWAHWRSPQNKTKSLYINESLWFNLIDACTSKCESYNAPVTYTDSDLLYKNI